MRSWQLRNLGLIEHDGQWLFSPTPNKRAWPTPQGRFLLHLDDRRGDDVSEDLAIDVIPLARTVPARGLTSSLC